ncbi:hypothetical protein ACWDUN_29665 [Mycobacterium sp. NPDC003323]
MTGTRIRLVLIPLALAALLLFILTSCPSNRDGTPGQLASALDETTSAAQSGALALDLWQRGRSSQHLAAVQLSDARDEVANSYGGISVLRVEDPVDLARQALLIDVMTEVIATLNRSNAAVRGLPDSGEIPALRAALLDATAALEREYR